MPDRRRISKLMSLILRHRPDEFGLNMDKFGFIPIDEVVEAVQQRYSAVDEEDIRDLIAVIGRINHTPALQEHRTHRGRAYPLTD